MAAPCKTGYLDVKIPNKTRGLKNWKTWKKRWVVISSTDLSLVGPPSLVIQIYSNDNQKDKNCLFWKSFSSKLSVVYRSRSRTHRNAFSIAEDGGAILHLAGGSESQSQDWMAAMRDLLWPPNPHLQLKTAFRGSDVSLIDNEYSYLSGILGIYGNFMINSDKLIILAPNTGRVVKEWQLCNLKRYQLVPQINKEDAYKVFSLTISDPSNFSGQLQFYSVNAMCILQRISHALDHSEQVSSLLDTPVEEEDLIQFDDYRRNPGATTDDELEDNRHSLGSSGSTGTDTSDSTISSQLLLLPDNMLNCSINSTQMLHDADSDSLSPPPSPLFEDEVIDRELPTKFDFSSLEIEHINDSHIYADISSTTIGTVNQESIYEELEQYQKDLSKKEMVPPLPPRNFYLPLQNHYDTQFGKQISPMSLLKKSKLSKFFNKNERCCQSSHSGERNENLESLVRTESLPIFIPTDSTHANSQLSLSAPETHLQELPNLILPKLMPYNCDEITASKSQSFHNTHFRERSQTTPVKNSELYTMMAELDEVHSKHRHFRQCIKALSAENLLTKHELSLPLSQCIADLKRFSSEYCNMKLTTEDKNIDSVYIDMNGIQASNTKMKAS